MMGSIDEPARRWSDRAHRVQTMDAPAGGTTRDSIARDGNIFARLAPARNRPLRKHPGGVRAGWNQYV
jgi:hypothetical protein